MESQLKSPVIAADRFLETMTADGTFQITQPVQQVQALQRQLDIERDIKTELQAQLKEEEQYRRKIEAERDREKAMRTAAESQVAIWQETEKKMRRDLEKTLAQEEQRRREVEQDRDKAHTQRRAAEVEMTVARQQLLAEVQLRRDAEQKLAKERDQNEWIAKVEELEEKIKLLEAALELAKSDAADVEQTLQKEKDDLETKLMEEKENARLRQAEVDRLANEIKQTEEQMAIQLAEADNIKRTAQREKDLAVRTTAQSRKDIELAKEKQESADRQIEDARKLKIKYELELEITEAKQKAATEAEMKAQEAGEIFEKQRAEAESLANATQRQKSELEALENKYTQELRQLEGDKAAHAAAREEFQRSMAKAREELRQREVAKLQALRQWTAWMVATATAASQPTNGDDVHTAQAAYQTAAAAADKQVSASVDEDVVQEWQRLTQGQKALEKELSALQTLMASHKANQKVWESKEATLKDDLEAVENARAAVHAEAQQLRLEVASLQEERDKDKVEFSTKVGDIERDRKGMEEHKQDVHNLAKQLEAAQTELEVEQRQWEQDRTRLQKEKEMLEEEREKLRQDIEAERAEMNEEQRAWEQERIRLDRLIAEMEKEKQALEERLGEGSPQKDAEALKLMSIGVDDWATKVPRPDHRPESAELPGVADLREEFESFRRARREAWQQGRRAHEQQERQWLQSYLNGASRQSPQQAPMPLAAVSYPGLRPAGKLSDWSTFRAVVIPLGTLIYLKHSFQNIDMDGTGAVDLQKLSWAQQRSAGPPQVQADTLKSMLVNMDAAHSGVITFWEFAGLQLFLLLRLGERGFDFREWLTFVSKSWHPNHFSSRGGSLAPNRTNSPNPKGSSLNYSYPGP
eukprot:GGOE01062657.1.p1 GENE.GGOE01062657.1~~GGOE01062657.1.p1  ORF type:complete len:869 (-),score=260.82 GGOE01062657.1:413-3019(-)